MTNYQTAAAHLSSLYGKSFGGKTNGRYRLSSKQLREMLGRKRLYEDDIEQLTRAALEAGLVLINMDSFFVVLSANTFVNYRRLSGEALTAAMSEE